jgi:hypothetical protein
MLGQYTAGREVLACLETVQDNVSREILAAVERLVHEVKGKGKNNQGFHFHMTDRQQMRALLHAHAELLDAQANAYIVLCCQFFVY